MMTRMTTLLAGCLCLGLLLVACGDGGKDQCIQGKKGCPCYPNRTCNGGLVCGPAGICELALASDGGTADASGLDGGEPDGGGEVSCAFDYDCAMSALTQGYLCRGSVCVPCDATEDCTASSYYGGGATCDDSGRCQPTPSCLVTGCTNGVCDDQSGRCREPHACDQAGCVFGQLCQEATGQSDAQCLPECVEGMAWNGVDGICAPIPPNCRSDWANSILAQCTAEHRTCVEVEDGASCEGCFVGYTDATGACVPVVTCGDLACDAEHRRCLPEGPNTDATCGSCLGGYAERFGVCEQDEGATCDPIAPSSILQACAAEGRSCVEGGGGAACGDCVPGRVENPGTGSCEEAVTCDQLNCGARHRGCEVTWNAQCTGCLTSYVEDPATGECVCQPGTLPNDSGQCETIRTCADIGAGCTAAGELCVEATTTHHAECQKCPAGQAWYAHQQTCLFCPPCTKPGETGRVYRLASLAGHCVCETRPGYYHSESGLGGTFACDKDGDGWVSADARLALEAPDGSAERVNARCTLRTIDRFVLENEWGERRVVLLEDFDFLFEPVPLFEPVNRDRSDKLVNDYDFTSPLLANYAPRYGDTGRELLPEELNPLTKACAAGLNDRNARYADYNADGTPDVDDPGESDSRADPEARIFAMFSYFLELHRGHWEPGPNAPHGQYVISEKTRSLYGLSGRQVALGYPPGGIHWRDCRRHTDSAYSPGGSPYTYDFARYGEDASCDWAGGAESWCGMHHHSQFKCMLVTAPAEKDPAYPHHQTSSEIAARYVPNLCSAQESSAAPLTSGEPNPSDPLLRCQTRVSPASGQLVWGAAKLRDYGHPDAPNPSYLRGCVNECVEEDRLPPEKRCQGLPPISCRGRVDDYGRLQCYRPLDFVDVPLAGQSFLMGSPDTEAGRSPDEGQHIVSFEDRWGYLGLKAAAAEVTQDQFEEMVGHNPSRFTCSGEVCPVEQVTYLDAIAFANRLSDLEGLPRCYRTWHEDLSFKCADLTIEPQYVGPSDARVYLGTYCKDHGGIIDLEGNSPLLFFDAYGYVSQGWQCDGYRLPTEAEWEFLARAGTTTPVYQGSPFGQACDPDPILGTIAWTCANAGFGTRGVTLKAPNALGLYDMIGNVWEWVADRYEEYPSGLRVMPEEVLDVRYDVGLTRGGAWNRGVEDARAARRSRLAPGARNYAVGFRVVRTLWDVDHSRFVVVPAEATWDDAEADCQARGGHLASVASVSEHFALRRAVGYFQFRNGVSLERLWIGLNDRDLEGAFLWSDGSPLTVAFWNPGEPNNSGGIEDCVELRVEEVQNNRGWNDLRCDYTRPYICEIP